MPLLVEVMSNGQFSPDRSDVKTDRLARPPSSGHPGRGVAALRTYPDCQRCALASTNVSSWVPSSARYCVRAISAPRSARDSLRETLALLPRWQSAFSPTTRSDRLLSWTSPAVAGSGSA